MELALQPAKMKGVCRMSVNEPNSIMLDAYLQRVRNAQGFQLEATFKGVLQDLYARTNDGGQGFQPGTQDLVMSLHMIYHLTNFGSPVNFKPLEDLEKAAVYKASLLKPGGVAFIVYANLQDGSTGAAVLHYLRTVGRDNDADRIEQIYGSRKTLFVDGGIEPLLRHHLREATFSVDTQLQETHIYGRTYYELAACCGAAEQIPATDDPFDVRMFETNFEFLRARGEEAPMKITRETEDPNRRGMLRMRQPQVVVQIKRET
jgi:hypothetical protein